MKNGDQRPLMTLMVNKKHIVILGAGYGGLRTALKLEQLLQQNADWRILLIDRYDFHQLKTELHEVAAGKISAKVAAIPILKLIKNKKIEFIQAEVTNIDFNQHVVSTTRGKISYDKLVIALGSETEFFGIPGLSKQAFTLSSIDDAKHIKAHIHNMFAQAKNEKDEAERQAMLTIVVGGGGFTGVELATELTDYLSKLCKQFGIALNETQLVVIEAEDTILAGFDVELANRAQQVMKRKGIRLMLKTPCVSMEKNLVKLRTGENVRTRTLIWTGGVRTCDLVAEAGLKYGPRSRVVVNPYLESVDHPEVYVIGDNALILDPSTNRPLAPTAQLALQQAELAALNIYAEIKGAKRVRYVPKVVGQFVSLGGRNAVGWVWKFKVTGFVAWFLKRITLVRYLYSLGGFKLMIPRLPALSCSSEIFE